MNSTMDDDLTTAYSTLVTSSGTDDLGVEYKPWLIVVASGLIGCVLIMTHVWIITSIVINAKLHTVSNVLLASLSLTNILVGIQNFWNGYMVSDLSREHPILLIEVFAACLHFVIVSYLVNSVAIAADRYFKVSRPMQYVRLVSMKKSAIVLVLVWGLSATFATLIFTLLRIQSNQPERAAITIMVDDKSFKKPIIYLMNATLLPAILTITAFTVGLIHIARRQQQRVKQEMLTLAHLRTNQLNRGQHSDNHPSSPNHLPGNIHLKTTVYFIVHFSAFVIAWVPEYILLHVTFFNNLNFQAVVYTYGVFFFLTLAQILVGTLFLTFTQREHREASGGILGTIKLKCMCR